jgi:hypothetical protein
MRAGPPAPPVVAEVPATAPAPTNSELRLASITSPSDARLERRNPQHPSRIRTSRRLIHALGGKSDLQIIRPGQPQGGRQVNGIGLPGGIVRRRRQRLALVRRVPCFGFASSARQ